MGINNTEFGMLHSISALTSLLLLFFGWIHNIFQSKKLLLVGIFTNFVMGIYVLLFPNLGFKALIPIYISFAVKEVCFLPAVLNYVRSFSNEKNQGVTFGLHEFMRRATTLVLHLLSIFCILLSGGSLWGIRLIIFLDLIIMGFFIGIIIRKIPRIEKNKQVGTGGLKLYFKILRSPQIWFIGASGMAVHCVFLVILLIVPFFKKVFSFNDIQAGLTSIFIGSVIGSVSSFSAGFLADKVFKSPSRAIKMLLYTLATILLFLILLPKTPEYLASIIIALSLCAVSVFMLRGLCFAPIAEIRVPKEMNGATMAVTSFVTYSPALWMNVFNGKMLDIYEENILQAYTVMYSVCLAFVIVAIACIHMLRRMLKKHRVPNFLR